MAANLHNLEAALRFVGWSGKLGELHVPLRRACRGKQDAVGTGQWHYMTESTMFRIECVARGDKGLHVLGAFQTTWWSQAKPL